MAAVTMTPPQQFLDDLPNWLTDIVFGNEVPQMRGESGRRSSAAWAQAGTEYDDLARRLREVVAALPDAVRGEFGDRITASAVPMCEVAEDSAKFCHSMSRHTDRSAADSDKEVYVMYAFGALTLYQLLLAGGVHPIRGLHILTAARAKHLTAFRAFVASRLGAGAAAAVERAGPLLAQVGGFAIAAGGVDLVVQAGQIAGTLDGHRDSVDWNSVLLATATGGGSALGGVLSGYAAHAVVSRANAPVLLGRAVVGVVSGVFGVIGGASTAAALTGEFRLSASALVSGVALGMAGAGLHARARSEPPPSLASHERAGPLADLVARPDALGTRELRPADAEPVRSSAADESGIAVGRPPDPAESVIAGHGDKDTSRPAADGSAVADRESATASTEPVGDPNATLYERINALRDREFAETEAAAAGAVAAPANISESIGGRASETPTVPGAELPSPSPRETPAGQSSSSVAPTAPDTEIAASGSVDSPAGPDLPGTRHDTESVADLAAADSMVPQRDPAEVDRLVAERDDARAELATLLGISPQELRWWGHEPVARALDENNAWQAKLAEQSSFRAEPGVRERELSSLGQRMAVKVRAGVAEARALASVLQWAQQFEPAGQPTGRTNGQWPAVRAAGVAERVPEVGRLLDGVERYRAADARVAAVDPRAADGTWDSAHPRYRAPDPRAEVTGTAPAGAGAAGLNPTGPGGAGAGRETAVGAAPSRDETAARAGADESLGADPVVPVPEQIQQLGAAASAEAVSMVRAADFAVLGQESTRAGSALARWLGLSDTEFYRMSPTRLRAAVEFQVERAERLPEWGEQARASAGELIGDTVRRGMAADAANGGGPVGDPVNPAQTLPAELLNRLQEWVGENAAPMQRWMEVHATRDRLLDTPALMLRLESVPADPVPVRGEVVLDPALKPVRELRDLEAVETRVASRMAVGALTPEAAAVLARSGLAPTVPAGPIPMSVAGTPPSGVAPATARDSSGSDGTGPYSAPEPSGTRPASSSSSAALGRHRADVRTSEVDPAWAAAVEQVRDARQRELAETAAAQTDSRDTSTARTDVAPSAKPSGTSAAANSVDPAPTSSAASESSTGHGDAAGRTSSTESASAHGDGHTASQTPTPPAKESTAPSSAVILGAGMAAMDDDESTGPSAPLVDSKSATTPLEPVPVPAVASDDAADTVPRVAVSTGEVPGDPADLRRSHAEATARAAELLGVAPQELRLWGRELLEQVIDRFTAWSSPSGGDGWNQLSPAAQQGLRPEVGELFGRQLREVAEVHRQAAAALDWLRAAELVPDGTAVPVEQRLAELRRLADAHGPSSPLHETVDVLDRYLTLDDRVAALPPEPLIEQAAASDDAAKTLPRDVPTVHDEPDEPDRPVDVRQSHAELAARAGELLQVAPQELRLWGRALLERVIDRFEFWSNPSGSDGWSQLSPTEQAGLAQDLPTLLGRWLRDLAEAHRTAAPVLDWLRTAGLEPDGTAVPDGRRLAELRRLAAEQGPSAPLHELADVLDGYLKIDAEVAAMPPEPIPAPNLSADRSNDVLSPSATPTSSARPRQSLGESWWFASPLRGEWIEVGHTLGEQARTLAREHGVEVDHWALRSDSPELARLRAERAARTAGLAELIGMSAEELTLRRIDEVRAEAAAEIEARSATQPPGTAERVIDLAEACLLMAALAGTAARFHWLSSRVGAAVPGGSGDDQRWLAQVIKLGPAELHRRMQVLGIPTRPVWSSPPVASSMPPRAVSAPGTVDSPGRVVRPDRPAAAGGRGRPTVVHRRPSPSDARPVTARITPGPGRRRPLAPIAGTGLSGTPDGAGEIRPPDVLPGSKPIDCAVHTFGYLSQENPNIAENLAGAAPTPDPGLGGTDGTQLLKALGGKRWVQFRTWLKIVDLLDNLGPGAAAYVVIESRRARRISGTGHARLVFHDRAQPGVIKWRDPLVEGGAKQLFEPGKFFPSGDLLFAVVYGADGAVYSVPEESTGISDQTGSSPRRAVAGVGDARHPEGDLGDHVRWLRADAAAELERQAVLARDTLSDIDLTHEVHGVSLARLRDRIEHIDAVAAALAEAAAQHQRAAAELTARIVECRSMDDEAGYRGPGQLRDTRMLRDDVRNVLASLLRRTDRSDAEVANATAWLRELDAVIDAAAAYEYRGDLLEMFERELADLDLRARLIHTTRSEFAAEPTTADPAPDLLQRLRDEHTAFDDRLHGIVHRYVDRGHADPGRHVTQARQQARFDADDLTQWLRQSAPFRRYQLSDREFSELLRPDSAARAQWRHALIARQDQLIRSVPYEPEPFASEHDRMRSMAEDLRHRADLPAESAVMFEDFDARFLVLSTLEGIDRVERRVERIDALGAVLRDLRSWLAAARAQGQTADILAAEFDRIATSAHRFARLADEQYRLPESDDVVFSSLAAMRGFHYWQLRPGRPEHQRLKLDLELVLSALISFVGREVELDESARLAQRYRERWDHSDHAAKWLRTQLRSVLGRAVDGVDGAVLAELAQLCRDGTDPFSDSLRDYLQSMSARWYLDLRAIARQADLAEEHRRLDAELDHVLLGAVRRLRGARYGDDRDSRPVERTFTLGKHLAGLRDTAVRTRAAAARVLAASGRAVGVDAVWHVTPGSETLRRLDGRLERARTLLAELWQCAPAAVTGDLVDQRHAELESISNSTAEAEAIAEIRAVEPVVDAARQFHRYDAWARAIDAVDESINVARWEEAHSETAPADDAAALRRRASLAAWTASLIRRAHLLDDAASARAAAVAAGRTAEVELRDSDLDRLLDAVAAEIAERAARLDGPVGSTPDGSAADTEDTPQPLPPDARRAVVRSVDRQRAELRRQLDDLLRPLAIDSAQLLDIGSPVWAHWSAQHGQARDDLIRLLWPEVEPGRVADWWLHRMVLHRRELGDMPAELAATAQRFIESHAVSELLDAIGRADRWARTIETVEQELTWRSIERRRRAAAVRELRRAPEGLRSPGAPVPDIETALASMIKQDDVFQRMDGQLDRLYRLGIAIADVQRRMRSLAPTRARLLSSMLEYGMAEPDSRPAMLFGNARLTHLAARPLPEPPRASGVAGPERDLGELLWESRMLAGLDDQLYWLNADLEASLDELTSELAGVPAAAARPQGQVVELPGIGLIWGALDWVRVDVAARRRLAVAALTAGPSAEFGIDTTRLDTGRDGEWGLTRLNTLRAQAATVPAQAEQLSRLDTAIGLVRTVIRTTAQVDAIDIVAAALDDANRRLDRIEQRFARLSADHLLRHPLDGRAIRATTRTQAHALRDAALWCGQPLEHAGWDVRPDQLRQRMNTARAQPDTDVGASEIRLAEVAERYLGLRGLEDVFDERSQLIQWIGSLKSRVLALYHNVAFRHIAERWSDMQRNMPRRPADTVVAEPTRPGRTPDRPRRLRHMLTRALHQLVHTLGPNLVHDVHKQSRVPSAQLDMHRVLLALIELDRLTVRYPQLGTDAVVRRAHRCQRLCLLVAAAEQTPLLVESHDDDQEFGKLVRSTLAFAVRQGDEDDDLPPITLPPTGHDLNRCARLVLEMHQHETGRPTSGDLSDTGLGGVLAGRYLRALGAGRPTRYAIDPDKPLRRVVAALDELVRDMSAANRSGVSIITIEGTHAADEHGVAAHTRRWVYRCDEQGNNARIELQDPGKALFGTPDEDKTNASDLTAIWAVAFDKNGNPLPLPGGDAEGPPQHMRVGRSDEPPPSVRGGIDGVREPSRAERAARLAELLARTEPLDRAEMDTVIDDASVLHPKEFGDCLAQLPGGQRECFTLRYQDGLSEAEVATQLHKTRKAVWLVERRMVRQLVSLLREELGRAGRFAELLNRVGSLSLPEAAAFVRDALALHPETTDRCLAQLGDEQREIVQPRLLDRLRKGPVTRLDNPVGDIRTAAVWRMVDLLPAELERHARLVEQVKQAGSLSISQASALIETACELRPKATTWCLPQLDDAERRWVELRYLEGLGRAEVATRLGVATESVEHAETSAVLRLLEVLPGALDRPARFAELMVRIDSLSDAEAGTLVRIALDMHPEAADRCLARLPETERECIRLRFRDELTRAAAAPRLKKPRQAVEQIEAYAAQRFVQLLPDELDQRRRFAAMVDRVGSLTRSEQSTFVRDALDLRREAADRCFAQLPAGQHECARLRFVAKLSRKEVADRLGTTTDAVKKSEGAAVSRLVQLLPGELYPVRRLAGLLDRVGSLTLAEAMTLVRDALALHPQETARCFAQLPSAQRETLRLRFMDGHSREAAAAQLGLTEGRVAHSETQGVWRLVALLPGALGRPRLAELLLRAGSLTPNERLAVVLEANAAHPGVIRNGLNRLAEDRRRCAELRIVQNLNDDEAAAELGTTVASVMALYQHAERQLVEWLAAELIPDPAAFDSAVEWVAAIAVFHGESRESFSAAIGRHHVWLTQALAMNSDLRLVSLRKVRDAGYISNAMLRGAIENFYLRQQYRVPAEATEEAKFWELIDAPVGSDKEKSILDSICRKFDGIAIAAESKWWRRWDRDHGELAQFFRRVILGAALQHVPPFSFSVHAWASCRTAVNRYYVEVIYAHLDYENATLVSKVDSYISKQLKKTGHEPDDEEIARALGLTVSDVVDAKRMGATSETSIDAPVRSDKPNSRAIDIGDPARPETDDVEFRDELLLALADMPNPALAAALVELCHVRDIPVADVAGRLRIDVTAAQALLAEAAERLRTEEFRAQLVAVRTRRMIDEVADASVAAEAEDGRPRHAVDDGTVPYRRPDGAMHDQCGRRVLELHGMRTGRSFVVPEPDGLAGSSLKRLLDAVGGRPQWFAVDPVRPRRLIDRALTELLRSMDSAAREGVSLLVAEIWQIPDGDGVMGHLDRAEYHCAADGSNGWLEEQDPGSGRLGRWGDSETGTELAGYVVSAFDPHGESVLLPGTAVVDLHDRFRVGRSDEERASKRAFFFLKWIRGLSRSSSPKKKADATLKRLNTGSISSNLTSVGLSTYSPLLVQQLSNSMQLAGLTASAGQLVTLLAKPAAGYIADRFDNRRTIQISSTAGLATSTAAGAAVLLGLPGAVPIVIGSALAAAATNTVGGAATTTYGRRLVDQDQQTKAVTISLVGRQTSATAGKFLVPAIGSVSPALPFFADAATYALYLERLRKLPSVRPDPADRVGLLDGARAMWADSYLRGNVLLLVPWNIGNAIGAMQLVDFIAASDYAAQLGGLAPLMSGCLLAAGAAGTLLAVMTVPERIREKINLKVSDPLTMVAGGVLATSFVLTPNPWVILPLSIAVGAGSMLSAERYFLYQQKIVPQKMIGGAMSVNGVLGAIGSMVGGALGGFLLSTAGAGITGWLASGLFAATSVASGVLAYATRGRAVHGVGSSTTTDLSARDVAWWSVATDSRTGGRINFWDWEAMRDELPPAKPVQRPPVDIRQLRPDDWRQDRTITLTALASAPEAFEATVEQTRTFSPDEWRDGVQRSLAAFVAFQDGVPIGKVAATAYDDADTVQLASLFVVPEARGRDVADRLIRSVVDWAWRQGFSRVAVRVREEDERAQRVCGRNNFGWSGREGDGPRGRWIEMHRLLGEASWIEYTPTPVAVQPEPDGK